MKSAHSFTGEDIKAYVVGLSSAEEIEQIENAMIEDRSLAIDVLIYKLNWTTFSQDVPAFDSSLMREELEEEVKMIPGLIRELRRKSIEIKESSRSAAQRLSLKLFWGWLIAFLISFAVILLLMWLR